MQVFDRGVKRIQRNKAASRAEAPDFDYLKNEIARRVTDRLEDIAPGRKFPVAVDVGCHSGHIGRLLRHSDHDKIQTLLQFDLAENNFLTRADHQQDDNRTEERHSKLKVFSGVATDEEHLPLQTESVDMIISSLSMHWINDLPSFLKQARVALKEDGVFLGAMFGGSTLQELRSALTIADTERKGGVSNHVSPLTRMKDIGDLISGAGFNLATVDTDVFNVRFPDIFTLMEHLQGMGEANASWTGATPVSRDVFLAAASAYEALYMDEDGLLPATFEVLYMIAWKPHVSQPKPKARGTAKQHLSSLPRELHNADKDDDDGGGPPKAK